jgi:hypothetical protein
MPRDECLSPQYLPKSIIFSQITDLLFVFGPTAKDPDHYTVSRWPAEWIKTESDLRCQSFHNLTVFLASSSFGFMTSFFSRGIPASHNHGELVLKDIWAGSASSAKSISGELIYFASVSGRDWSVMLAFMAQQTRKVQGAIHHSGGSRKNYLLEALNHLCKLFPKSPSSRGIQKVVIR